MADERKIGSVEIDRLYDFLDGLQASGYTIDPRQYLALSDLLMALIARGDSLEELPLKTLIAPLICSTPAEQQDFYQRFDRWYPTLRPTKQAVLPVLPSQPKRRWSLSTINRTAIIWVTIIVAVVTLIFGVISNSTAAGTQVINSTVSLYGAIFAVFGFMVWFGWRASILYQENQYITRELANQEPLYTKVPVKAYIQDIMPVMQFKPIVSTLRKRTQVPSSEVDVDRTIANALNRNNWLEIVYRQWQVMPEYVVLIDRKSRLDQQARFVQEVLAKLATDGVWLHQYEFSGDPRICFPLDRKDTPLRLKDLQARHPDSRLLIFSGTNELINPLTGLLQDWLESLSYWQERAILTPDKLQKVLLEELQSRDFAILPMTFDGLASLVRAFEMDNVPILASSEYHLSAQLTERPMRWSGRNTPPETEVNVIINELKNHLSENGFYWLCATAVYPELRWELTLHLGSTLKDNFGKSLLDPDLLIRLSRLPWFRFGYMPDWFRSALIRNFSPSQENDTRKTLTELLSTAYKGEGFALAFARNRKDSLRNRTTKFIKALLRNSSLESTLQDHVFIEFIARGNLRKLSLRLPVQLRKALLDNSFSTNITKLLNGFKEDIIGFLREIILSRVVERGRAEGAPTVIFTEKEISVEGEEIIVGMKWLEWWLATSWFYHALPYNAYGVISYPNGRLENLPGGLHKAPPGLYRVFYVDKLERSAVSSPVSEITTDGEKITLRIIVRYQVQDPVVALGIDNLVDTMMKHIETDVAQYIRTRHHTEIADSADIQGSRLLFFFTERHNRREPLVKAVRILSVELKEFMGDKEYIDMRRKARVDMKLNELEKKQFEMQYSKYKAELALLKRETENSIVTITNREKAPKEIYGYDTILKNIERRHGEERLELLQQVRLYEIELEEGFEYLGTRKKESIQITENKAANYIAGLETRIKALTTEIGKMKDRQEKEKNESLRQIKLLEIDLNEKRTRVQRQMERFYKAIDGISETLSSGYPMNSETFRSTAALVDEVKAETTKPKVNVDTQALLPEINEWYQTQLREIELNNLRERLQQNQAKRFSSALDAIATSLSGGYPTNPTALKVVTELIDALKQEIRSEPNVSTELSDKERELYEVQSRAIELEVEREKPKREYQQKIKAIEAIRNAVSSGYTMSQSAWEVSQLLDALVSEIRNTKELHPTEQMDEEKAEIRKQSQEPYKELSLATDEITRIYMQAIRDKRDLSDDEAQKVEQLYKILKQYENTPPQKEDIEKLTKTLLNLLHS